EGRLARRRGHGADIRRPRRREYALGRFFFGLFAGQRQMIGQKSPIAGNPEAQQHTEQQDGWDLQFSPAHGSILLHDKSLYLPFVVVTPALRVSVRAIPTRSASEASPLIDFDDAYGQLPVGMPRVAAAVAAFVNLVEVVDEVRLRKHAGLLQIAEQLVALLVDVRAGDMRDLARGLTEADML